MRPKFFPLALLLISSCLTLSSATGQESNASLAETVDFLLRHSGSVSDVRVSPVTRIYEGSRVWKLDSPEKCTLVWTTQLSGGIPRKDIIRGRGKQPSSIPVIVTIGLADLNPQKVGSNAAEWEGTPNAVRETRPTDPPSVYLSATDSRNAIRWQKGDNNDDISYVIMTFSEPEMASRYANALKHAVRLCGGKPDGQKKEPF